MKIYNKMGLDKIMSPVRWKQDSKGYGNNIDPSVTILQATEGSSWKTYRGNEPTHSYIAPLVDDNGNQLPANAPSIGAKGLNIGGGWTNLFTNVTPTAEMKALTAQKYCLQVFGTGSSATCSYGTATEGSPLVFTATAGNTTFTPTTCTKWQLSANGGYVFSYAPPGITVPAASATTGGNGTNTPLDAKMIAALSGGQFTMCSVNYIGVGSGELSNLSKSLLDVNNNASTSMMYLADNGGTKYICVAYDGAGYPNIISAWNRDEIHIKTVQSNPVNVPNTGDFAGKYFRVTNQRFTAAMVPIDANPVEGAWALFDGSFNPLTHLRLALNGTIPLWARMIMLSNKYVSPADCTKYAKRYIK